MSLSLIFLGLCISLFVSVVLPKASDKLSRGEDAYWPVSLLFLTPLCGLSDTVVISILPLSVSLGCFSSYQPPCFWGVFDQPDLAL